MKTYIGIKQKCMSMLLAVAMVFGIISPSFVNAQSNEENLTFAVMSDAHYFPTIYNGTRAEDYQNQISGDMRLMGEGEALTTAFVDQMLESSELPSVLMVTGDLASEGELESHKGFATQMKRLQDAGILVLVIPGNHDLYITSAMSFQDDTQTWTDENGQPLWTTEAQYREIYASMGYNVEATMAQADFVTGIEYFAPVEDGEIADRQGGLSYLVTTNQGFAFLMLDSAIYTSDENGSDSARGIGGGMLNEELLVWIEEKMAECQEAGLSVISGMHHPLLVHNTSNETEFITDRVGINRSTEDVNMTIAKRLANAGLRWIFTGHMHENDIASYTTAQGNTIYDMETGGLVSYPSPYRVVTATQKLVGEKVTETLDIESTSVKMAAMNACLDAPNGAIINTEKVSVADYMLDLMYGEDYLIKFIHRYMDRYLDQLSDVPSALENIAGLDLYETLYGALPSILSGTMTVDLGSNGTLNVSYSSDGTVDNWGTNDGVHLNPLSGTVKLLGSYTIRNDDIKTEVASVLDQFEEKYIESKELNNRLNDVITDAVSTILVDDTGHTLEELLRSMFTRHNTGEDVLPLTDWQKEALAILADGELLQRRVMEIIQGAEGSTYPDDVYIFGFINEVTNSLTVNMDTLFGRNAMWSTVINEMFGSNPTVSKLLNEFGVNVESLLNNLIHEYLSDSFFTSVGGLIQNMISGYAVDADGLDDVVDGKHAVLTYSGEAVMVPSVENGVPYQITVSLDTENAQENRTFSWYTSTDVAEGAVQYISAKGISDAEAAKVALATEGTTVTARTELTEKAKVKLNLLLITTYDIIETHHHTAQLSLKQGAEYWYRVGGDGLWSEPVLLRADGTSDSDSFTFINVADSQGATLNDYTHYNNVLKLALETYEDAAFVTHLGDMVDDGINENYWTWVLDTQEMQSVPVIPVAGNHEGRSATGDLQNAITAHYNLDIPQQDDTTGVYYSYVYKNATFIILNTNDGNTGIGEEQLAWARSVAENADTEWTIVLEHKSVYSKGPHAKDSDVVALRNILDEFCADYGIDLVLAGHDHTYLRTPFLSNGEDMNNDSVAITREGIAYELTTSPVGTAFVTPSTSGVKYYTFNGGIDFGFASEKEGQPNESIYSAIEIEGNTLYYTAYTQDGAVYDTFAIEKGEQIPKTAVELVEELIDALPAAVNTSHAEQVQAARAAYEALSQTEQVDVKNISILVSAEITLETLATVADKGTVVIDSSTENPRQTFIDALNNTEVGTILFNFGSATTVTPGTYGSGFNAGTLSNQYYSIGRNLVIQDLTGNTTVERFGMYIQNGATVVVDNLTIKTQQKAATSSSSTTAMNMFWIQDGTLITQGNTNLLMTMTSGKYNSTSYRGHVVYFNVAGEPSKQQVYFNGTGTIDSVHEAIIADANSKAEVYISAGNFTTQNSKYTVATNGNVEISGGTLDSVQVTDNTNATLTISGGTVANNNYDRSPIASSGDVYISGGTVQAYAGNPEFWLGEGVSLYVSAAANVDLALGAVNTDDNIHVSISTENLGNTTDGSVYALSSRLESLQAMIANTQGALDTEFADGAMQTVLTQEGVQYVYGAYHAEGSAIGSVVGGYANDVWVYSATRTINNIAVDSVQVSAKIPVVMVGNTLALRSSTFPYAALNNKLVWTSADEEIATVNENGIVTAVSAGEVEITATAPSGVSATLSVWSIAPELEGADVMSAEETELTFTVENLPSEFSVLWSVAGSNALMYEGVLTRNTKSGVSVEITATVLYNEEPTSIQLSKTVMLERVLDALTVDARTADGQIISSGVKTNQDIIITVTGGGEDDLVYSVDGGENFIGYGDPIEIIVGSGEEAFGQYLFAYLDAEEDYQVTFDYDISKVTPKIDGIRNEGILPENSGAPFVNSISVPEEYTATLDGVPYESETEIAVGTYELVLADAYGNVATYFITVPEYVITWTAPENGTLTVTNVKTEEELVSPATLARGENIIVVATGSAGYRVKTLAINGDSISSGAKVFVDENMNITASFTTGSGSSNNNSSGGGSSNSSNSNSNKTETTTSTTPKAETVTIPEETMKEALQEDGSFVVEVAIDATTKEMQVDLSAQALATIKESAQDFTISSSLAKVTLSEDAIRSILGDAKTLSLHVEQVATLTQITKVFQVEIVVDGEVVSHIDNGMVKISLPYTAPIGIDETSMVVQFVSAEGEVAILPFANCAEGEVVFATSDLGTFSIVKNEMQFSDTASHEAAESIAFVASRKLLVGYEGAFNPEDTLTRAMFVSVIARLSGADLSQYTATQFEDVASDDWYSAAVKWAVENKVVSGVSATSFAPNQEITYEQMAVMLANYTNSYNLALREKETISTASTEVVSDWAVGATNRLLNTGVISSKAFDAQEAVTRGGTAEILKNLIQNVLG